MHPCIRRRRFGWGAWLIRISKRANCPNNYVFSFFLLKSVSKRIWYEMLGSEALSAAGFRRLELMSHAGELLVIARRSVNAGQAPCF